MLHDDDDGSTVDDVDVDASATAIVNACVDMNIDDVDDDDIDKQNDEVYQAIWENMKTDAIHIYMAIFHLYILTTHDQIM